MTPRLHVELPLREGVELSLPPGAARHVQVLRLQPQSALTLFNGDGGEWAATVLAMGRSDVTVRVGAWLDVDREMARHVTLALGMPANERMDTLIEKATELGVAALQPLHCERSVLRLSGERAEKKLAHWRGVAQAACEQSGRTRLPRIEPVRSLPEWLASLGADDRTPRLLLSLRDAAPLGVDTTAALLCLSGPEGGLSVAEEDAARARGFVSVSLGARVLRADTAPLALLAHLALAALRGRA
jgi:16S rRNA (uracil1498-N3)-methyltransferase